MNKCRMVAARLTKELDDKLKFVGNSEINNVTAVPQSNRVSVTYVPPKNPAHQHIYERLKEDRALEKLQKFLSPFRLPRTLKVSLAGCDGEADAFYGDDAITNSLIGGSGA